MSVDTLTVSSKVYVYPGAAAWHFVGIPLKEATKIKNAHKTKARPWGSLPVEITLGTSVWKTSLFPDKKSGSYLLPLKASVRKTENIYNEDIVTFTLRLL